MLIRTATIADIPQIQIIRNAVKENILSDPALVTDQDCEEFMMRRGKGWVCESNNIITGFAIADLQDNNIWALFVHPDFEGRGIGKSLHDHMLDWYFEQGKNNVWLGTAPHTRAEKFYRKAGWAATGIHGRGEIKFEMGREVWTQLNGSRHAIKQAMERLQYLCDTIPEILMQIEESHFSFKPAPGKWSKKEIVGHLIDSAANNHHRLVRGQFEETPVITYNQDQWNHHSHYQQMDGQQVIGFWTLYNKQLLSLIKLMPEGLLERTVSTGGTAPVTLGFLFSDYVAHLEHHLRQITNY